MSNAPPPDPVSRFASVLRWLNLAIFGRFAGGRAASPAARAIDLVRETFNGILILAEQVRSGACEPCPQAPHRPLEPPPRESARQKSGWLPPPVPDAVIHRNRFVPPLREAEVVAPPAAAPVPMRRLPRLAAARPAPAKPSPTKPPARARPPPRTA